MARTTNRRGLNSGGEDGRRKDYVPATKFQAWAKPLLAKNEEEDKSPRDYQELTEAVVVKNVEVTPGYMQKVIRGSDSRRPSYELALAIGQILGDIEGALRAADYPLPPAQQVTTREIPADSLEVLDYYEQLPPGPLRKIAREHLRSLHRIAGEDFHERTDIVGKRAQDDEDGIEVISADDE